MSNNQECSKSLAQTVTLYDPETSIPLNLKNARVSHSSFIRLRVNEHINSLNLPNKNELSPEQQDEPFFSMYGHILFQTNTPNNKKSIDMFNGLIKHIPNILFVYSNIAYGEPHGSIDGGILSKADVFDLILIGCFFQSSLVRGGHFFIHATSESIVRIPLKKQQQKGYNIFVINGKRYYRPLTTSMLAIIPSPEYINRGKPLVSYSRFIKTFFDPNILANVNDWNFDDRSILKILNKFSEPPEDTLVNDTFFVPLRIDMGTNTVLFNSRKSTSEDDRKVRKILIDLDDVPPFSLDRDVSEWYKLKLPVKFPIMPPGEYYLDQYDYSSSTKTFGKFLLSEELFSGPYPPNLGIHVFELHIIGISGTLPSNLIKYTNVRDLEIENCNLNLRDINIPTKIKKLSFKNSNNTWEEIMEVVTKCKRLNYLLVDTLQVVDLSLLKNWILNKETRINDDIIDVTFINVQNFQYPENFDYMEELNARHRNRQRQVLALTFNGCNGITGVHPCFLTHRRDTLSVEFDDCPISRFVIQRLREDTWGTELTIDGRYIVWGEEESEEEEAEIEIEENKIRFSVIEVLRKLYRAYRDQDLYEFSVITESTCDNTLIKWLNRIFNETEKGVKILKDLIPDILNMIETMDKNPEFMEESCNIINGATESCGDRVILSILYISMQYKLHTIQPELENIKVIYDVLLRGPYVMYILERIAREKIPSLRFFDEVEVYLTYPIKLRDRFKIPIATDSLLYYGSSGLNDSDLYDAAMMVEEALKNEYQIVSFLETQKIWTKLLFENNPDIYNDIENLSENIQKETRELINKYDLTLEE
jgi:hypothetical protein